MNRTLTSNLPSIVFLLAVLLSGAAAQAQEPSRHGRAILEEFCARCHAIDRAGNSPQPLAPPFRTLGDSFNLDQFARQLERGLASGHPEMPEFKFTLEDARAIGAYLRSIQQ